MYQINISDNNVYEETMLISRLLNEEELAELEGLLSEYWTYRGSNKAEYFHTLSYMIYEFFSNKGIECKNVESNYDQEINF